MRIDQDTFKENELNFGMYNSTQRNNLFNFRLEQFKDLLLEDYPEHYMRLTGDRQSVQMYLYRIKSNISFKHRNKLVGSLIYSDLECVNTNEFKVIIGRFKRFLLLHKDVSKELEAAFNKG